MAKHPDLSGIEKMMRVGEDFSLTGKQYLDSTGRTIPKSKYYAENESAAARCARRHGHHVEIVPTFINFIKD